ncbi:hypothetical protein [Rhodococcoides fascians]|uniref:hypothetical protein n=1 Tax=Rhodococcoides fascians TaxID=1828 RepID=UPI0012FD8546|nr:hypothetical protein [Rhodococcus fascians]
MDHGDDDAVVIPVNFGTGRGRRARSGDGEHIDTSGEHAAGPLASVDDADAAYDAFDDLVIELTPRQRCFVETAAWLLADDVYDAAEDIAAHPETASRDISILSDFPPCTWTQPVSWWREQARCFDDLAEEAQNGADPEPRSTGEEMALHLILGRARALATDEPEIRAELVNGIDAHPSDDDWDGPLDFLFQDHDVLTLFDDDTELRSHELHPGAVNLAPQDWFTPFADSDSRQPSRGYRR